MAPISGLLTLDGQQRSVERDSHIPLAHSLVVAGITAALIMFRLYFQEFAGAQKTFREDKNDRELLSEACFGNVLPAQNESIIWTRYWQFKKVGTSSLA